MDPMEVAKFLREIQEAPQDSSPKLKYADYCRENGFPTLATVWEWVGKTGRSPYRASGLQYYWCNHPEMAGPQHSLPVLLWKALTDLHGSGASDMRVSINRNHMALAFQTLDLAIAALVPAWVDATTGGWLSRWRPSYQPIMWVAPGHMDMYRVLKGHR